MIFKPTISRRNVVVVVHIKKRAIKPTRRRSSDIRRITRISVLFSDHKRITEETFMDSDEAILLSRFWRAMQPNDRIYGADVAGQLEFVRRRSWSLRVIPSTEICLRQVYCHELCDTQRIWRSSGS